KFLLPTRSESRKRCENDRFVFFPLQYPIESRLTTISPEFFDQRFVIEYLARILPHDVHLFVKQHPNHVGYQSPKLLLEISNRHNVRFLHPDMNTHEVIENADLVTVINNTVGFEAIYHRVPLLVLGTAFYEQVPAATNVDDLSELPELIAENIGETTPEETTIESIYSLQKASIPDLYWDVRKGKGRSELDGEIDEVVDVIVDIMQDETQL
ncbi:MAG: hypothetical protein ABEI52_04165, partial [Halobacteriaceae archaeon]